MIRTRYLIQLVCILSLLSFPIWVMAIDDPFSEQSLRVGFFSKSFPDFTLEDIEVSVKMLSEQLGVEVGVETKVTIYDDLRTMRKDFEQGRINFVVSSSLSLVTEFDGQLFADGIRLVMSSDSPDQVVVLAQKKSGKSTFKEFIGKRLVMVQFDPMTDLVMEYLSWHNFKQGYQASFIEIPREKKAHQLILKLFFDQADITCVYNNSYQVAVDLNPQLREQLEIIANIDGIPQGAGLFHINTPLSFRTKVIEQALKISSRSRGQQLLQVFKADKVLRATSDDLLPVKKLYDDWRKMVSN